MSLEHLLGPEVKEVLKKCQRDTGVNDEIILATKYITQLGL